MLKTKKIMRESERYIAYCDNCKKQMTIIRY